MKSSFLLTMLLGCLVSVSAFSQTRARAKPLSKKEPVKTQTTTQTVSKTQVTEVQKSSFDKFYERLKISYFGAFQGSSLTSWDGLSADEGGAHFKDYAHNVFNQISFNFNYGGKFNFVINPRFTINTGDTQKHGDLNDDFIFIEDMLVAFQGVLLASDDKKFTWWTRNGARLPTSRGSRAADITWQPESFNIFTYDFSSKWQFGTYVQLRLWVHNQAYTSRRYRVYTAPYLQYAITPKDKVAIWYENYSENRNRGESFNGKIPVFKDYWQNAMLSYSKDLSPTVNFMPFLGYHLNTNQAPGKQRYAIADRPLDPMWLGFWLSWQIK